MRYRIITSKNFSGLEKDVNLAIAAGWQPLGGLAVNGYEYAQALVIIDKTVSEKELEQSWRGEVDRASGAFSNEEKLREYENRW